MMKPYTRGEAPDIIIPKRIPIQTPAKIIRCAAGNSRMNCKCGHFDFGVHVTPTVGQFAGTARVAELICLRCGTFYKLDPHGNLGGGKFNGD